MNSNCDICGHYCNKETSHLITRKNGRRRIKVYIHKKCWDKKVKENREEWQRREGKKIDYR